MADPMTTIPSDRLQWILENTKDIIYTADADGNVTYISPQVSLFGVTPDQIIGSSLLEYVHPADLERVMLDFQETVRTGREFPTRFRVLTPDGRVVHLEEYGKVAMVDGKVAQVTGVLRDITDRAAAEQARLESEERFRAIFDRSRDCVFVADFEGRFLDANQATLTLLGYRADEVQQITFQSLLGEEDLARALAGLAELLKVGAQHAPSTYRARRKDGAMIDVETTSSVIYRGGVPYAILGVARDITGRRRIEEALRASEERLRIILDNSRDIIYAADARGKVTYVSPQVASLGLTPDEVIGTDMFALVHPDDRPSVMATFLESLERELNRMHYFRLVGRDGRTIHMEESGKVHRAGGRATGITGILRDVTERRRIEEALRLSEDRFRRLVDNTDTGFVVIDDKGVVVEANAPYARLAGASDPADVIGRSVIEWTAPDERGHNADAVARCARRGFIADFETAYLHPDGKRVEILINATTQDSPNGAHIVSYCRDITARKRLEAEREGILAKLQKTLAEVKQLSGIIPICAGCKKVRDDKGYWTQVELYIREHSDAEFSHGLCPDCMTRLYPKYDKPEAR